MPTKIAVNGCGRIGKSLQHVKCMLSILAFAMALTSCHHAGRLAIRIAWARPDTFQLVHLNDITAIESVAYLLKYDSVHGELTRSAA